MSYTQVELAEMIARFAHRDQVDKVGQPYIKHPERVAAAVGNIWQCVAAAWLHDVVEDTQFTLQDLSNLGVDSSVLHAVDLLTKKKGVSRQEYIEAVKADAIALHVKKCDLADNSSPFRIQLLPPADRQRLISKYERDRVQLYA